MSLVALQVSVHLASLLLGAHGYVLCTNGQIALGTLSMLSSAGLVIAFYLYAGIELPKQPS